MPNTELKPSSQQRAIVNALVSSFENDLRSGKSPQIEDYLDGWDEIRRPLLTQLLLVELNVAGDGRAKPTCEQYKSRFAQDQDIVEQVFGKVLKEAPTVGFSSPTEASAAGLDCHVSGEAVPQRMGRFLIQRKLGQGGFGVVYLAHDPKLDRLVALKMPKANRFRSPDQLNGILEEARKVANLKHPLLVAVYDIQEEAALPYIIQEYIDGGDLGTWSKKSQPTLVQLARILEQIADAIGFAHQHGLTHCDLKLANVLMDSLGNPHIADFGLAVHETLKDLHRGQRFGTPPIMAPEQVRGEGHRLDGRTDIWAMGVMMYQLLVSIKPFTAIDPADLFDEILNLDPKPPRQINPGVPRELERICLKCLSKRRSDRYNSAEDLRDDLNAWINQSSIASSASSRPTDTPTVRLVDSSSTKSENPLMIVPKGLRSFDADDSDFFLDLLPGPRHRDGLPESIRFWKNRIEETDADRAFSVGLIYGPSGCGKSSFVKAGLLPNLESNIRTLYVIATANNTEAQILKQLRRWFPDLDEDLGLAEAFAEIRSDEGNGERKLLLVLDQFEQWLHAHPETLDTELTRALRQCDGSTLQSLLLVRDDFYLAVNRLFQELEIELQEGRNYRVVDLFDRDHARKLLAAIGRAYGKFDCELTAQQQRFLNHVIDQLAIDGKVICVRLALFCEMMKSRPYTLASLEAVGGFEGLGVTYLEESFSRSAPPSHRAYEKPIRSVLTALLPEPGTAIKGSMRSQQELREVAGYESNDQRFGEIIRIVLSNWVDVTQGPVGISGIPRPSFFGLPFTAEPAEGASTFHQFFGIEYATTHRIVFLYFVILALALLTNWFTLRIRRLPIGRAWEALREDEIASRALGINPTTTKLTAFAIGAMFGGLAGAFFATRQGFISPESFTFIESATVLAIVVLGGLGSQIGVVLAAAVLVLLPEIGREFSEYRMLLFGLAMILIMIWRPHGLLSRREPTIRLNASMPSEPKP